MAVVSDLVTYLEGKVETLVPGYIKFPFCYSLEDNTSQANKNYAVNVGSANSTSGLNGYITVDHSFEVKLAQKFIQKKGEGDSDLRAKIATVSTDIETLYKSLYRRPGGIASAALLLISPVDVSAPDIDNDNNLVTLTLTLNVKYRVAT
jgi:hypothetical protein